MGALSIGVGGVLALRQDVIKQVLAYSTISQYGYLVMLYGIGSAAGNGAAAFYVLAHGVAKSALFMAAGAVTMATGEDRLSRLGGLGRRMPLLAAATGLAAANLAALPLTVGFFKDELFFTAAFEAGPLTTALAVAAAALTFAYIGRFWMLLFLGPQRAEVGHSSAVLVAPVAVLAVVAVLAGLVVAPFTALAAAAGTVSHGAPITLAPAYHLDARPANVMALAAWVLGGLLIVARRPVAWVSRGVAAAGERVGPRRIYEAGLHGLSRVSSAVHDREVRDLRTSVAAVLVPAGLLIALAFAATPTAGAYTLGDVSGLDWLIVTLLGLVVRPRDDHRVQPGPRAGGHQGAAGRRRQRPAASGAGAHRTGDRAGHGGPAARPGASGRHGLPHRRARRACRRRDAARGGTRVAAPGGPGGDRDGARDLTVGHRVVTLSLALLLPWASGAVVVALDGRRRAVGWLVVAVLTATLALDPSSSCSRWPAPTT